MSKSKIVTAVLILLLVVVSWMIVQYMANRDKSLVNPGIGRIGVESTLSPSLVPAYNPPQEIKYDSSTDLKQELETVNPQVLDSDFEQ